MGFRRVGLPLNASWGMAKERQLLTLNDFPFLSLSSEIVEQVERLEKLKERQENHDTSS